MSTIIKLIPKAHATKRTTVVQATNDGIIRTRIEDPVGTDTDKSFNFSALAEGDPSPAANEPVIRVDTQKIGTAASYVIEITNFYDESLTGDAVPTEYFIWYDYKTKADEAPDSETPQTFPITMLWTTAGTPQAPTRALSPTVQTVGRLYQRLASLDNRRQYIKFNLLSLYDHPKRWEWAMGGQGVANVNADTDILVGRTNQTFIYWLEMLTRVISIDDNLNTEAKFNLINGDSSLDGNDLIKNIAGFLNRSGNIFGPTPDYTSDRSTWDFRRLGSVANTSPYGYVPPTLTTHGDFKHWVAIKDTTITLVGADVGDDWVDYLRN